VAVSPLSLRRWGLPAVAALVAASGCSAILGLTEVSLDPGAGGGGSGGSTTTTTGTGGHGGSTTSTTGTGGDGGQMVADFQLSIGVLDAPVPLGGYAFLNVEIQPSGGFAGAVDVAAQAAVAGLDVKATQIPAGATKGVLQVGVTAPFTLGQKFTLKLQGKSGALAHLAEVPATVTGKPGTLDLSFASEGVTSWPTDTLGASLTSLRALPSGILVSGSLFGPQNENIFGARLLGNGGLDLAFNANGKPQGLVKPVFCGCGGLHPEKVRDAFRFAADEVLLVGSAPRPDMSQDDIVLARYGDDGVARDVGGDKGLRFIDAGGDKSDVVISAAMAAGPKLVVLGSWTDGGVGFMFASRITGETTGLDPLFGNGGRVIWQGRTPLQVLVDSQDRTIVLSTENTSWHVDRLLPDGSDDIQTVHAFGVNGIPIGATLLPNDGLIVFTKETGIAGSTFGLWHLEPDLTLTKLPVRPNPEMYDPSGGGVDDPVAAVVLPDGRLMVAGNHGGGGFLARILADGTPDPTFGDGLGWMDVSLGPSTTLQAMSALPDGKVLIGGTLAGSPPVLAVGRVWN
jgi:hypothetical protein